GSAERVEQPAHVALERESVRKQVVRQPYRLRALQVRIPGEQRVGVLARAPGQRVDEVAQRQSDRAAVSDQPQPQRRDDSVVAGEACSNARSDVWCAGQKRALDGGVDVLVAVVEA